MSRVGIERLPIIVVLLVGIATSFAAVWSFFPYDAGAWLIPWFDSFLEKGRVRAFSEPIGNYTPPYLYLLSFTTLFVGLLPKITLIKLLSIAGIAVLALAVRHLLRTLQTSRSTEAALWMCLLPSVVANAPMLSQCDSFWVASVVMASAAAVRRRAVPMLAWAGLAFAFKAQAIFLAPAIVGFLIAWRVPIIYCLIPVAIYAVAMLPAWLVGWPAYDLATVYLRQSEWNPDFIGNAANPWVLKDFFPVKEYLWVGLIAAVCVSLSMIALIVRRSLTQRAIIEAMLLSSMAIPFVLPKMHERYFFAADILSFSAAWIWRDRISICTAAIVQAASTLALLSWLHRDPLLVQIGAILMTVAISIVTSRLFAITGPSFNKGPVG